MELVPDARIGNYLLVHAGMAIELLEDEDAEKILETYEEYVGKHAAAFTGCNHMINAVYRDRDSVTKLSAALSDAAHGLGNIRIMHVCGTHEHEIRRFGIRQLLPDNVAIIAGPGCPVCITPASAIATARALALHEDHPIVCTYGDMIKVPVKEGSLLDTRGHGGDVRIVYGIRETVGIARSNPERRVVFFSVGFETTAAPVAAIIKNGLPDNLLIYNLSPVCSHGGKSTCRVRRRLHKRLSITGSRIRNLRFSGIRLPCKGLSPFISRCRFRTNGHACGSPFHHPPDT